MEVYGEKPKRFTAKWFEYVWEYYKMHIIITLLVIVAVVYTWIVIASATKYDFYLCIAGDKLITDENKENLKEALRGKINDINGDGEINIEILDYSTPSKIKDVEFEKAMNTKLELELQAGDSFLYMVSKNVADSLVANPAANDFFENPKNLSGKESDNRYFAKAEDSAVLKDSGIPYNDLYVGVREFTYYEGDEKDVLNRNNAIEVAKYILGN